MATGDYPLVPEAFIEEMMKCSYPMERTFITNIQKSIKPISRDFSYLNDYVTNTRSPGGDGCTCGPWLVEDYCECGARRRNQEKDFRAAVDALGLDRAREILAEMGGMAHAVAYLAEVSTEGCLSIKPISAAEFYQLPEKIAAPYKPMVDQLVEAREELTKATGIDDRSRGVVDEAPVTTVGPIDQQPLEYWSNDAAKNLVRTLGAATDDDLAALEANSHPEQIERMRAFTGDPGPRPKNVAIDLSEQMQAIVDAMAICTGAGGAEEDARLKVYGVDLAAAVDQAQPCPNGCDGVNTGCSECGNMKNAEPGTYVSGTGGKGAGPSPARKTYAERMKELRDE